MTKAAQPHPQPHRVALAAHPPLHLYCHRAAVVDLLPQVGKIHPCLPAGIAAAACGGRRKGGVAGRAGAAVLHGVSHFFRQDILAPAVHQRRHDQRQIHLPPKAGVVGRKAVFRQIEPPVQRVTVALFPRKGAHRRRQQTHRRGDFIVVGGKVHLQLHAGAAARGSYRDGIAHQKDHAVLAVAGHAAPGIIRCPLAKAHPARPRPCRIYPAAHLHHGVPGCVGVPADVQVAEGRHGKLRGGVAAVQKTAPCHAVQHQCAVFQRNVVQLPAGKGLCPLQHKIIPLFHGTSLLSAALSLILPGCRRRRSPLSGRLPARRPSFYGCSPRCGTPGQYHRTRSGRTPR